MKKQAEPVESPLGKVVAHVGSVRGRITEQNMRIVPSSELPQPPKHQNTPEIWKEFSALKKRVEKIERLPFIRLFLGRGKG